MRKTLPELRQEYLDLCHAMQSGVAMEMNHGSTEVHPKHMRVGVNSALVDSSALAQLLMKKGIIDEQEYYESLVEGMRAEVTRYEKAIEERTGAEKITLV
jgi:hypothetical protein